MPKEVTVEVNPAYKAETPAEKKALSEVKDVKPFVCSYQTALENVRNSKGMFRIAPAGRKLAAQASNPLTEKSDEEIKLLMLQLGIQAGKDMTRSDAESAVEKALASISFAPAKKQDGD